MPGSLSRNCRAILFDLDGAGSCLSGEVGADVLKNALRRLSAVDGVERGEVWTNCPEMMVRSRALGIAARWMQVDKPRSEDERIRQAVREACGELGPNILLWNLHYPDVAAGTLSDAIKEGETRPLVSIRDVRLSVHRYFTFRLAGRDNGNAEESIVSGDVLVARRVEGGRVRERVVCRPSEAAPPEPGMIREWGQLCVSERATAYCQFEIPDKWRFDVETQQWFRLEEENERLVRGRHQFPSVPVFADAVAAGPVSSLRGLDELLRTGGVRAIRLNGREARRLSTSLDLLKENFECARSESPRI